jgi:GNAT superfamily N-acetyltransferase
MGAFGPPHDRPGPGGGPAGTALAVELDHHIRAQDDVLLVATDPLMSIASSGSASSSNDHHPHGSYYYLQFLGVAPGRQGQGIGAALMAPVLKRCDREGMRAYLDATSERSKTLYERHGFEAEAAFALPGGPPLWPMWRWPALGR